MSKMSELAAALDDLTEIGRKLADCGEDLIRAAASVKECFSDGERMEQPSTKEHAAEPGKPAKASEPAAEPEKPAAKTYSREEVRAMLADLSQAGFRAEAKALVKKYSGGGSLTDIDPARYPELVREAKQYHA